MCANPTVERGKGSLHPRVEMFMNKGVAVYTQESGDVGVVAGDFCR